MHTLKLTFGLVAGTLIVGPNAAVAQNEGKAFCLQSPTGSVNCIYDSLEQCHEVQGGRTVGGGCIPNPARAGTTGAGGMNRPVAPPAPLPPAGGGEYLPPPSPRAR